MRTSHILSGVVLVSLMAAPAFAHPGPHNGLAEGLVHPFSGWDHMAAMAALGLWLGNTRSTGIIAAFIAFAGALLAGFLLGVNGLHIPFIEAGILASVFVFGLLALTAHKLPAVLAAPLIAVFALCHGHAHGAEVSGSALLFGVGFMSSSILIAGGAYALIRVRAVRRARATA